MKYWLLRRPFTPVAAISASTAFAKQFIARHQPAAGLSSMRDIALVYRRMYSPEVGNGYQEIHHHHHQRIEWKPQTHVSIVQPMLVRNHYFWRLLALEGHGSVAARPWNESEWNSVNCLNIDKLASSGSASGAMPSAMLQLLMNGDVRRLPSDVWLEAHMDQDEGNDAALPPSLRIMGSLPQLIFRQMAGSLGGGWVTGGGVGDNAYIQPYEWTLDTSSVTRLPESAGRRRLRELTRLTPLMDRSDSYAARFGSGAGNRPTPRFRWLPPVRLSVPLRVAPDRVRSDGERNIRRLSDLFQVSRLNELDNMLGGTYTVQLLNIWPSPEQTAAALPYPSWQPIRREATRDPEDWLYHIVRLFNPHERRAVIEHNIRRLYQRAAERSFHQQAGRWSRLVMTSVRQEWRRQAPAGTPVAGLPEQFVRRQGNRWLWNQSALAGSLQWRQAGERLREWWPWLNLPWLQGDSGDESLRRELYHPLLLRRYLNEDETMGIGADSDTRWLQGNIYETLGRYIERETLRLSTERFMMLLPLAAALPGQKGQRSSLRQLARERTSQQLSGLIPRMPFLPALSTGLVSGAGTAISTLVQRMSGRELAQELLRTRSVESSELALRLARQDSGASVQLGANSRNDLQLEASRWLLHAVQAEQRSNMSSVSTGSANGLLPERMLLAFRHSESATSAPVSNDIGGDSTYIRDSRSVEQSGIASSTGRELPLRGVAEPAMLELLRRRIQLLPERMLTRETEQHDNYRRVEPQRQEAFVPEWRRTREPAPVSAGDEGGNNRTSNRTSEGSSNEITAALSGSESPLASKQPVRLGSAELEQIVQRVYRELQRRLKSDYQRRGM